jgi:hypothetical protein
METILVERPAASSAILCHCDIFVFVIAIFLFVCNTAIPALEATNRLLSRIWAAVSDELKFIHQVMRKIVEGFSYIPQKFSG